tara:strand:- start:1060 stop:1269 length:210 start_codon:yes stop_codon:yes gene_type:complete
MKTLLVIVLTGLALLIGGCGEDTTPKSSNTTHTDNGKHDHDDAAHTDERNGHNHDEDDHDGEDHDNHDH